MAQPIIEVEHLVRAFDGRKAVDDLSFVVQRGDLFAFLGQNGAGKSTTINMIIGLLAPDGGRIVYAGSEDFASFKNQIGVVFQDNTFDNLLTVEENLGVYGSLSSPTRDGFRRRRAELVELLDLKDLMKKRFGVLSGGQKRKAEIARALFASPSILFLDEPTTGLDPRTRAEVWELLRRVRRDSNMTLFLTTHYLAEAADADQVVIIHEGRRVCEGSPAELKARYSSDKLMVTPRDPAGFERQIAGRPFTRVGDTYALPVEGARESIDILARTRENVKYFEAVRGSMEDVFLTAVGERIGQDG
ncbi:MAG: ABC transporter ATP-binding protein [Bifidobacteriaceae bacterium]|jgi:multidrug/hemolysin transport system ATP-binding protein|nr:ABC transporter ATP-binding protein [Bifidobacteriaceae bacterium]